MNVVPEGASRPTSLTTAQLVVEQGILEENIKENVSYRRDVSLNCLFGAMCGITIILQFA